jgi:hypothetical protein
MVRRSTQGRIMQTEHFHVSGGRNRHAVSAASDSFGRIARRVRLAPPAAQAGRDRSPGDDAGAMPPSFRLHAAARLNCSPALAGVVAFVRRAVVAARHALGHWLRRRDRRAAVRTLAALDPRTARDVGFGDGALPAALPSDRIRFNDRLRVAPAAHRFGLS